VLQRNLWLLTTLLTCIRREAHPPSSTHTTLLSNLHFQFIVVAFTFLLVEEQGKATLESLTPWKKTTLGMNRIMSSSKFILSLFNYSHIYELEYSCDVIILIYELVYSLCVMRVSSLTLCLIKHITYIMKIRAKLGMVVHRTARCAQFITCRSVGSESRDELGSLCIHRHGAWVWRGRCLHCPCFNRGDDGRW